MRSLKEGREEGKRRKNSLIEFLYARLAFNQRTNVSRSASFEREEGEGSVLQPRHAHVAR